MTEKKRLGWKIWTTAVLFVGCSAWFVRDFCTEAHFPYEPIIGFFGYLFTLLGIFIFRGKPSKDSEPNQSAEKIWNIGKIKKANFSIYVKGSYVFALVGLLAIGIWQKDSINRFLGNDRLFKAKDENFKILILPFKKECEMSGKNYDAGYVLKKRIADIARKDTLKIKVIYWEDYLFENDFADQSAKHLQRYHHADMLIYGAYQTSDCSAEGDQICLNYVTDDKWNLGETGTNFSAYYQKGGLDDLKKGKLQDKIESIAILISTLAQIKSIDTERYLLKLKEIINDSNYGSYSKAAVYIDLAHLLSEEGKTEEAIEYYKKTLDIALENQNFEAVIYCSTKLSSLYFQRGDYEVALSSLELTHEFIKDNCKRNLPNIDCQYRLANINMHTGTIFLTLGDYRKAENCFREFNRIMEALHKSNPKDASFKGDLAISIYKLGMIHSDIHEFEKALPYFQRSNLLFKELYETYNQNLESKYFFAISLQSLGDTYSSLHKFSESLENCKESYKLMTELNEVSPHNISYKENLARSHLLLGTAYSDINNQESALQHYQKGANLSNELVDNSPGMDAVSILGLFFEKIGSLYISSYKLDSALFYIQKHHTVAKIIYETNPTNFEYKRSFAISYIKLSDIFKIALNKNQSLAYLKEAEKLLQELRKDNPLATQIQPTLKLVQNYQLELRDKQDTVIALSTIIQYTTDTLQKYKLYGLLCDNLRINLKTNNLYKEDFVEALNNHAWYGLFLKQFKNAEIDIREGLSINSNYKFLKGNLAHALLLQGKYEVARIEYQKLKDQSFGFLGYKTYREAFIDDLKTFEKVGAIPPERQEDVAATLKMLVIE